jgi:hypothetical protein
MATLTLRGNYAKPPVDCKAAVFAAALAVFVVSLCLTIAVTHFDIHPHIGGTQPLADRPK